MGHTEGKKFTGFIAHYTDDTSIQEKENYYSNKLKKKCATNWAEIDRDRLSSIELLWHGETKARIDKVQTNSSGEIYIIKPSDWFFSHTGCLNLNTHLVVILSRNIGYIKNGILNITSVFEQTGIIRIHTRAA